jgi:tetratricopeptide (TPR) repeat protein
MLKSLCFVLMPFGKKPGVGGLHIDFDVVYHELIRPSIEKAGLMPLRADEEMKGGFIDKPMFERLILCEYAVADLTTANANVFYELGIRHAVRSSSTVMVFAEGVSQLPFDVFPLRALPYKLNNYGRPINIEETKTALNNRLIEAKKAAVDSPIFELVENYPDIDHTKTDVFRDRISYSNEIKDKLAASRKEGVEALRKIEKEIGNIADIESGAVIDLFLSYRSVKAWPEMIDLVGKMSPPLAATVMVLEQLALALNRIGKGEEAEKVLNTLIEKRGPSSETYGILGRVFKDRWETAKNRSEKVLARALLDKAIEAYLKGFEADWRDAYPGINAVTLMELKDPPDPRRLKLIPLVEYAVERRIAAGKPDYWDHATLLELAILIKDQQKATSALGNALTLVREIWEPETTARNLRMIREIREQRNEMVSWAKPIEEELERKAKKT